jgi:hypothetical protein
MPRKNDWVQPSKPGKNNKIRRHDPKVEGVVGILSGRMDGVILQVCTQ